MNPFVAIPREDFIKSMKREDLSEEPAVELQQEICCDLCFQGIPDEMIWVKQNRLYCAKCRRTE